MRELKYDFARIEPKWQKKWLEEKTYHCENHSNKPKFYGLVEFPYPSGQGLHVGHARPYTAMDVVARKKRMDGYNVLFPMGYDAFGLPTENYAIKNHIHPAKVTHDNIANFTKQLQMLGYSFDWDRVINTTDPEYYKWTQWIFLQLYKHGLAYKTTMPVNWCTSCKCVLANEEVVEGVCERCGAPVIRKEKSQWMLKITEYAQRLIDDLDGVDFIERVKIQQKNWIGRSTGAEVTFQATTGDEIVVFTTRPDTLFGATYMVISPEHPYVKQWADKLENLDEVSAYVAAAARKSDFERTELAADKEKTGVQLRGVRAVNPVNGREIPIFLSDYVLASYGTGAIMAVPAHDTRDWAFAKKFGCEIIEVVSGGEDVQKAAFTAKDDTGILVNSDFLNGKTVKDAIPAMIMPLIIIGGTLSGVFTATESAAIACIYALIVTFAVYREIPLKEILNIMRNSLKTLAMVMALIGISSAFGWVVSYLQIPTKLTNLLLGISSNKIVLLLIINLLLLIMGTMMDMICSILIITPIILPVVTAIGMSPIQLGVIMILNLGIGLITPPVGVLLFVCSAIAKRSIEQLTKAMLPFYAVMIAVLLAITFIPQISTTLPNLIYGLG